MKIAILGPGAIGSTFAFYLAKAGHEVTVVARTTRLAQLQRDGAIVLGSGEKAPVQVATALDPNIEFDLVLVTVLLPQVDAVLPALKESKAKKVMFMFNTFEPLARLRDAVGANRFAFGFPAVLATFDGEGKLTTTIVTAGQVTTVTDPELCEVFSKAGITSVVHEDMESWLRTHVAFVVPFMIAVSRSYDRKAGISWSESWKLADAMDDGLKLVRRLGNKITPAPMVMTSWLPRVLSAAFLFGATRSSKLRKNGAAGMKEAISLIESMEATAPGQVGKLRSLV